MSNHYVPMLLLRMLFVNSTAVGAENCARVQMTGFHGIRQQRVRKVLVTSAMDLVTVAPVANVTSDRQIGGLGGEPVDDGRSVGIGTVCTGLKM